MNIQIPPVMRDLRRPKCSITYRPPKVVPKFTPPRIIWVTYVLLIPAPLKITVPCWKRRGIISMDTTTPWGWKLRAVVCTHIVEEIISTSQLLKHLKHNTQSNPIRHAWSLKHLNPPMPTTLRPFLSFLLFLNLEQLVHNNAMILRHAVEFRHSLSSGLSTPVPIIMAWTFRE